MNRLILILPTVLRRLALSHLLSRLLYDALQTLVLHFNLLNRFSQEANLCFIVALTGLFLFFLLIHFAPGVLFIFHFFNLEYIIVILK